MGYFDPDDCRLADFEALDHSHGHRATLLRLAGRGCQKVVIR